MERIGSLVFAKKPMPFAQKAKVHKKAFPKNSADNIFFHIAGMQQAHE
ncbi:MAG: hypothetical protein J6T56_03445 [Bacteroidales bacterium]|nr:hypothetical protein [Bacteroidales bacterium]MBP5395888.1 hypothetical protein [Bacteroidales bacterium]MBP5613134.1 hypothetical protein [Bacteroidales bacterium]